MRSIVGYLFLLLLLFSCAKEDSQYFPFRDFYKVENTKRIRNFTSYNNQTYAYYEYNDKGLLQSICDVSTKDSSLIVEYKYDFYDRLIYSKEFYDLGRLMETYHYKYTENQVIINVEISSKYQNELVISEEHRKWILHYDDLGECISNEVWWYTNKSEDSKTLLWNTTYTWVNGNVVTRIKKYSESSDTSYYEFDSLPNPDTRLSHNLIPEYALSNLSKNNIIKETYKRDYYLYNGIIVSRYIYTSDSSITKQNYLEQFNKWSTQWKIEFE